MHTTPSRSPARIPRYEALDRHGRPFMRAARVIGELPTPAERLAALEKAGPAVAKTVGLPLRSKLGFGEQVFRAFGLTLRSATRHPASTLLLTHGDEIPLSFVNASGK